MQPGALRALEFDRIVEAVAAFALTPMGGERLNGLQPSIQAPAVADLLAHTTEAARFLAVNGLPPLRASPDLPQTIGRAGGRRAALEPLRLLALAGFLESIDETRTAIRRAPVRFPASKPPATPRRFEGRSRPAGKIDRPERSSTREPRAQARSRAAAEATSASAHNARIVPPRAGYVEVLQDQVITERNGRYVLVIKSEHRRRFRASCTARRRAAPACISSR